MSYEQMVTYTAIHIQAENRDLVQVRLEDFLRQAHGARLPAIFESDGIGALYGGDFLEPGDRPPTIFAITTNQSGWLTVHYNSFYCFRELLARLSHELDCTIVLVMAQSVSDAYYMAVYQSGEHLRTLQFSDGGWKIQEGAPLSFESQPLGRNIALEDEEPYYIFDAASVRDYCRHLGLTIWRNGWLDESDDHWTILRVQTHSS